MARNQLFKKILPIKLIIKILNCFGFNSLDDKKYISKKDLKKWNTVEKIKKLVEKELKSYYLPCKSKIYLKNITEKMY
jgi:hypothetical protein